jgi:hypothetical protein
MKNIIEQINNLSESDLVRLNNLYCIAMNYNNDEIYNNDEDFFDTFFKSTFDAVRAISYGSYVYSDEYVKFDGYGNLVSFNYMSVDMLCESVETIAKYISENPTEFEHLIKIEE